jgi:hypothetical protein
MTGQGRTSRRGYGHPHQQIRRQVKRIVDAGRAVCWRCHRPIHPAEPWASAMSTATSPDTQDPSIDGATEQRQQTPRDDGQTPLGAGPRWPAPWRSSIPATNWRRRCRGYELARRAPVQQVQATAANDLSEGRRQRTVTVLQLGEGLQPAAGVRPTVGPVDVEDEPARGTAAPMFHGHRDHHRITVAMSVVKSRTPCGTRYPTGLCRAGAGFCADCWDRGGIAGRPANRAPRS